MAALDFPNSPTTSQTYTGPGGVVWSFDGQKWANGASATAVVSSWNARTGAVTLTTADVTGVGGAPLAAPVFTGDARAVTATAGDNDTSIATTAFVMGAGFATAAGVTNASNAAAGQVGEYLSVVQAVSVGLTNNTAANITQLSLTAGDWDVDGAASLGSSAGAQGFIAALNTTTGTLPANNYAGGYSQSLLVAPSQLLAAVVMATGTIRLNVTVTTVVYLVGFTLFTGGTVTAGGSIRARRVR